MKKLLSLLLAVLMVLSLVACAAKPADTTEPATDEPATGTESPADEPAAEPTEEPADEPAAEPTEEPAEEPTETPDGVASNLTVVQEPTDLVSVELPLVTEPVTLNWWWPSVAQMSKMDLINAEDYLYFREMEDRTGVKIEITVPSDAATQFGLMMASEEYPDFIEYFGMYYTGGLDHAIEEELVEPLEDYADLMPNLTAWLDTNPEVRRQVYTDSGHLPGIPLISYRGDAKASWGAWAGYVIRQDWLNELDMEVPTTYDELGNLLAAIKESHGSDENLIAPFQLGAASGNFLMNLGGSFMGGYNISPDWMMVDGEVKYAPMEENFKAYIQMLADWYAAGYIDPDIMGKPFAIWTTAPTAATEQFGVFPIIYTHKADILSMGKDAIPEYELVGMPTPKLNEDDVIHTFLPATQGSVNSVIMADSEHIELMCKWWDYFFSPEGIILGNYGVEGLSFHYTEDGKAEWDKDYFTSDDPAMNLSSLQYLTIAYNSPGLIIPTREFVMVPESDRMLLDIWQTDVVNDWNYPAAASKTLEENEEFSSIMGDITTYVSEFTSQLLIGAKSFDEYDDFVAALKSMGIEDAIAIQQAAADRYSNR